jgi:hypothetical protein
MRLARFRVSSRLRAAFVAVGMIGAPCLGGATAAADDAPADSASLEPAPPGEPPAQNPAPPASPPTVPAVPALPPPPVVASPYSEAQGAPSPGPRFGDEGHVALSSVLSASFGHLGYSMGGSSTTSAGIEPAFDYFSVPNFSEGLSAFVRYSDSTSGFGLETKALTFGLTGQVGINLWLGERVSIWPKLAVGAWQSRLSYNGGPGMFNVSVDGVSVPITSSARVTENVVFVELYAPFLFHATQHLFVGFGPDAYVDVLHSVESGKNLRRFFGASSIVGGWF